MGKHGDQDKPADGGKGKDGDGQNPSKHGSEGFPDQSGDGQDPNK
ncbi:hypothetical protein GCM10009799_20790 [Nocardiopsis rhodophaea]|uniref:Uncharacterized protein n=1 Tax=Nocardiopsis rhodophaea TaxID=280238 RepID=A0ABN2SXX7_9ACTN